MDQDISFPHPKAVKPSGILAIAGDLKVERLLLAYHYGIYPWYNNNEPIIWWCPSPRFILYPEKVKVAKSMHSYFNLKKFTTSRNRDFESVIMHCQKAPGRGMEHTWLNEEMREAYIQLHKLGYAISLEVWDGEELVGGLYGIQLGRIFFGESMFSLKSNASKFGFITLCRELIAEGVVLIDCQQPNTHLLSLGGEHISGHLFHQYLWENRLYCLAQED